MRLSLGTVVPVAVLGSDVAVIGAGYAGLAAACQLRKLGHNVTVFEKHDRVGGRAHVLSGNGFTFDAGPSWYWMPQHFEQLFGNHGRTVDEFYNLTRLEPAYRIVFDDEVLDIPGTEQGVLDMVKQRDPESVTTFQTFWDEAKFKYDKGMNEWVWKPMISIFEMIDIPLMKAGLTLSMFTSFEKDVFAALKDPRMRTVFKWPVIFLGAGPQEAPSMYSLMTYAGHGLGTWYPSGGMAAPAQAWRRIADDLGVKFRLDDPLEKFEFDSEDRVTQVCAKSGCYPTEGVVAAADYHHVEQEILPEKYRKYGTSYWTKQVMAPSCLLYYLGVNASVDIIHHTFFFDKDLDDHLRDTFEHHKMHDQPAFYVSATSKTDPDVAPEGGEALFILVPISYALNGTDTQEVRRSVLNHVLDRMEAKVGAFREKIVFEKNYGPADWETDFHAFRGHAFGHANLLSQSLIFKPSMQSAVHNLVYAGHMTNPGPGMPTAMVSGVVAADLLHKNLIEGPKDNTKVIAAVTASVVIGGALFKSRR